MTTTYKEITGYPGYRVGSDGTVWRLWITCRSGRKLGTIWKPMKLSPGTKKYLRVNLVPPEGGSYKTFTVQRLVMEAFVGKRPPGMECRHLNNNKSDNRLENLKWGTQEENRDDNHQAGSYGKGETHTQAKLTEKQVIEIRKRRDKGEPLKSIATDFNIGVSAVSLIARRKTWAHVK